MKILEKNPFPHGKHDIKILHGFRPPLLSLGAEDYRVVYRILDGIVEVLAVVDRNELEKKLRQLKR